MKNQTQTNAKNRLQIILSHLNPESTGPKQGSDILLLPDGPQQLQMADTSAGFMPQLLIDGVKFIYRFIGFESYLEQGKRLLGEMRLAEALLALEKAIEKDPKSSEAYNYKCQALFTLREYNEANKACKKAIREAKDLYVPSEAYLIKAQALYQLKKYQAALDASVSAMPHNPNSSTAYLVKAQALYQLKRYSEALTTSDIAIMRAPRDYEAYLVKAQALYQLKKYDNALEACELAIELRSNDYEIYAIKAQAQDKMKHYKDAQDNWEKAIDLNPESIELYVGKAQTLYYATKYESARIVCKIAIDKAKRANKKPPSDAYLIKGQALYKLKSHKEARTAIEDAITSNDESSEAYFAYAQILFQLGKHNDSLNACRKAIIYNSKFIDAYIASGRALIYLDKPSEALRESEDALALDSNSYEAYIVKSQALFRLGQGKDALDASNEAIKINSQSSDAYATKAQILYQQNEFSSALEACDNALKHNPKNYEAYIVQGQAHNQLKQFNEALKAYKNAIKCNGEKYLAYYNKGEVLLYLGHYDKAIKSYEKAKNLNRLLPQAYINMGLLLISIGNPKEALITFKLLKPLLSSNKIKLKPDEKDQIEYFKKFARYKLSERDSKEVRDNLLNNINQKLSHLTETSQYHIFQAAIYLQRSDYAEALKSLITAKGLEKDKVKQHAIDQFHANLEQSVKISEVVNTKLINSQNNSFIHAIKTGSLASLHFFINADRFLILQPIIDDGKKIELPIQFAANIGKWDILSELLKERPRYTKTQLSKLITAAATDVNNFISQSNMEIDYAPLLYRHASELTQTNILELINHNLLMKYYHQIDKARVVSWVTDDNKKHTLAEQVDKLLSLRILVYFKLLVKSKCGRKKLEKYTPNLGSKLEEEILMLIETLLAYREAVIITDAYDCSNITNTQKESLKKAYLNSVCSKIVNLGNDQTYCYHTGHLTHSLYVNFTLQGGNISVRIDNLGDGHERHLHYVKSNENGSNDVVNKRVYPFLTTHQFSKADFMQADRKGYKYLDRLFQNNFLHRYEPRLLPLWSKDRLDDIYTKESQPHVDANWDGKGFKPQNKKEDCILRNLNAGVKIRHGKETYKSLRTLERKEINKLRVNDISKLSIFAPLAPPPIMANIEKLESSPIELFDLIRPRI